MKIRDPHVAGSAVSANYDLVSGRLTVPDTTLTARIDCLRADKT